MSELIELTDSEIEAVGGGSLGGLNISLPNITLPNLNLVLAGNLNLTNQTAIALAVLSPNSTVLATNAAGSWQSIITQFG